MRTTLLLFSAALALTLGACGSPAPKDNTSVVPCICGTDEAMLDGCPHPLCISGEGNPDNPDCVCGTMHIGEGN